MLPCLTTPTSPLLQYQNFFINYMFYKAVCFLFFFSISFAQFFPLLFFMLEFIKNLLLMAKDVAYFPASFGMIFPDDC